MRHTIKVEIEIHSTDFEVVEDVKGDFELMGWGVPIREVDISWSITDYGKKLTYNIEVDKDGV